MAALRNRDTRQVIYLRSAHVFGRNPDKADSVLFNLDASQIHASIRWDGHAWLVIDHSRNGTFIDDQRIGGEAALETGRTLRFALGDAAGWEVVALDPPCAMLLPPRADMQALTLQRFHLLPDDLAPESTVALSPDGQWLWEDTAGSNVLRDGAPVRIGADVWTFAALSQIAPTSDLAQMGAGAGAPVLFNFTVSQNEEHISLTIAEAGRRADLGERTHHYSLLTLARLRLDDAARGTDATSQGWVEVGRLARMLGLDAQHLNIQIFRVRSQIARAFPDGANLSNVIERRRGEVRFGAFGFQIVRGAQLEGTFTPDATPPSAFSQTRAAMQAQC
ncbi:FHA domain-containing protein [Massilia sp. CCM 8733]|uniref:FHA domain-containing protein n=1 Tax=Massilia mucilaginosa TaxID=2609282 RepID=A0ABX0NT44_9BURK|nr:FHA domain-containing protein [Massilia mucilaginosa]NHZ89915.1 FHA domain-containing protein [Massilia mucilaginosa]